MNRGALYAEEHDLILRRLPENTGRGLLDWFKVLDRAKIQSKGYLRGLEMIRDRMNVPHHEASAIVWSYLNRSLVPDELQPKPKKTVALAVEEDTYEPYETGQPALRTLTAAARRLATAKAEKDAKAAKRAKARPKAKTKAKAKARPKAAAKAKAKARPKAKARAAGRTAGAKKAAPRSAVKKRGAAAKRPSAKKKSRRR